MRQQHLQILINIELLLNEQCRSAHDLHQVASCPLANDKYIGELGNFLHVRTPGETDKCRFDALSVVHAPDHHFQLPDNQAEASGYNSLKSFNDSRMALSTDLPALSDEEMADNSCLN